MRRTNWRQGMLVTCWAVSVMGVSDSDTRSTALASYSSAGLNSLGTSFACVGTSAPLENEHQVAIMWPEALPNAPDSGSDGCR